MLASAVIVLCLSAAPNPLVGRWDDGAGFVLVLEANGQGALADHGPAEPLTWKNTASALLVTQDGETVSYAYTLKSDTLRVSGGDLDQPILFRRGTANEPPRATTQQQPPKQVPANATATCPQACQFFLTCAAQLGAVSTANRQVQTACLQECQGSGMTQYQLAVFTSLTCQQAVAFVLAAEQAARGQQQQKRSGGACDGCVRWGDDCMWTSQSDWGPGHYGNRWSGAVSSCDSSCCGM